MDIVVWLRSLGLEQYEAAFREKSRLTAALLERIASEPHTRLRYFCSPQRTDSALFPILRRTGRGDASNT